MNIDNWTAKTLKRLATNLNVSHYSLLNVAAHLTDYSGTQSKISKTKSIQRLVYT